MYDTNLGLNMRRQVQKFENRCTKDSIKYYFRFGILLQA